MIYNPSSFSSALTLALIFFVGSIGFYIGANKDQLTEKVKEKVPAVEGFVQEKAPVVQEKFGEGVAKAKEGLDKGIEKGKEMYQGFTNKDEEKDEEKEE